MQREKEMRLRDSDEIDNFELIEKAAHFQKVVMTKGTGLIISYSPLIDYSIFTGIQDNIMKWAKRFGVEEDDVLILPETVSVKVVNSIAKGTKRK
jgi:hypothetical protein